MSIVNLIVALLQTILDLDNKLICRCRVVLKETDVMIQKNERKTHSIYS